MSSDYSKPIPTDKAIGIIVGVITILLPNFAIWSSKDNGLLGQSPLSVLLVISGCGGAIMAMFLAYKGKRLLGAVPGLVAGLGATGLVFAATKLFGPEPLKVWTIAIAAVLGALPSLSLALMLKVIDAKTPSDPT